LIKAFTWGTFSYIHAGHRLFLDEIKSVSDELHIILIPDLEVFKNKKYFPPDVMTRKNCLNRLKIADYIHVDSYNMGLKSVLKYKPEIFIIGYDQNTIWEKRIVTFLRNNNLNTKIIHSVEFFNGIHSSHLR